MGLQNLSVAAFTSGALALAGTLFLLQRLRVRHREQDVVTTLFWREAVEETRARVFVQRFRHPWAYLLALVIAGLCWLAIAEPQRAGDEATRDVFLLDGSAGMAAGDRFAAALDALEENLEGVAPARREVLFCGARVRPLLVAGEHAALLSERLDGLEAQAAPAIIDEVIQRLGRGVPAGETLRVHVVGDAPLEADSLALLPDRVSVRRVATAADDRVENRGLTSLGVRGAASGEYDRVDVLVEVQGDAAMDAALRVTLDGSAWPEAAERDARGAGVAQYVLRDLPAAGGRLEVRLEIPDALSLDDEAAIVLPERSRVKVRLDPRLVAAVGAVIEADPALERASGDGEVAVWLDDGGAPAMPSLLLVAPTTQDDAFFVTVPDDGSVANEQLAALLAELALDQVDATSLADLARRPISVGLDRGAAREVRVWDELLGPDYDFVASRAFPLFVARSLRWLAGRENFAPWVAAGERVAGITEGTLRDEEGRLSTVTAGGWVPLRAGDYADGDGRSWSVSLLDLASTRPGAGSRDAAGAAAASSGGLDLVGLLLLAAFLLLGLEWFLFQRERIP